MKQITNITVLFLIALLSSCGSSDSLQPKLQACGLANLSTQKFLDDFETAIINIAKDRIDYSTGETGVWTINADFSNNPGAVQIVNDPVLARSGNNLIKFTVMPGDFAAGGNRAEIALLNHNDPLCGEAYYGWSFMLAPSFTETGDFQTVGQWHGRSGADGFSGGVPVSLQYQNGVLRLLVAPIKGNGVYIANVDVMPGQWVDLIFHIKWSLGNDGYVEAWANGSPITPFNSSTGDYRYFTRTSSNGEPPFLKLGLYRSTNPDPTGRGTATVYYDNIKIGNLYSDML